jgi:catechol 2,3-dioxygenase-like lactoylglutathione lyase family enzyme
MPPPRVWSAHEDGRTPGGGARVTAGVIRLEHVQLAMPAGREAEAIAFYEGAHAAFIVDDVRALASAVSAAGHVVVDDEPLEGYDRVYVSDPFGNRIELMQPLD